jgi:hypothetical protein
MKKLEITQMENINGGTYQYKGLFCGMAIAAYGIAAASLVMATGGTGAVLLAGLGYSIATPGLAACFI